MKLARYVKDVISPPKPIVYAMPTDKELRFTVWACTAVLFLVVVISRFI